MKYFCLSGVRGWSSCQEQMLCLRALWGRKMERECPCYKFPPSPSSQEFSCQNFKIFHLDFHSPHFFYFPNLKDESSWLGLHLWLVLAQWWLVMHQKGVIGLDLNSCELGLRPIVWLLGKSIRLLEHIVILENSHF